MAGLDPAIDVLCAAGKTWMPGARPGTTSKLRRQRASLLHLARILHVLEGLELDIVELAIDLLDLADVDILHDVAGLGVDRDGPARAFPCHPLHGLDQLVAV